MKLERMEQEWTVCRIADPQEVPAGATFFFLARTDRECSLVCPTPETPGTATAREDGWRAFRVAGTLDFSLVGILAKITGILAENGIGLFAVSTFDTDYLLVRRERYEEALALLERAGYEVANA